MRIIVLILFLIVGCTKKEDQTATVQTPVDQTIQLSQVFKNFFATDQLNTDVVYSPQGINFGELKINKKLTKNIQISNGPLLDNFSANISIEEKSPKIFTLDSSNCTLLKENQNCSIQISALFTDLLFTSTKTARLILGKKDGVDIYVEIYASLLGVSITSNQFESNYSISMNSGFSTNYQQYTFQERIITITNNSTTRYLRNDYISPLLTGSNPTNFYISSNQCLYPVASGETCQIRIIYKKWKTSSIVSDTELTFPDKSANFSLKYGQEVTYSPILSDWGTCSASAVCSGTGNQTRTISQCIKNGQDQTDTQNCTTLANLTQSCNSPSGSRTIQITGGSVGQTCSTGSTNWVNDSVVCNADFHQGIGYVCVADTFTPTFSSYNPATNPFTNVCEGSQVASRSILSCVRDYNLESVPVSKCSDPASSITYKSPQGTRSVVILNGIKEETCLEGATSWTTSNIICDNGYYRNGSVCSPILYTATYSSYNTSPVSSTVCSGQDTVYRTITNCIRQDNNASVSVSLCTDPAPSKIVQSPAGTQLVSLFDSFTTLQSGTQSQFCAKGATSWIPISTSCFQYYTSNNNSCEANNLTSPQAAQLSGTIYSNQSALTFTAVTDSNASALNIYSDSNCSNQIGNSISLGVGVWSVSGNVSLNSSTPIYAKSSNSYTQKNSSCSFLFTYIHDNLSPQASMVLNNGANSTTLGNVNLNFSSIIESNGISTVQIFESNNCTGSSNTVPFSNNISYNLINKGGSVNISAKLFDYSNNSSNCLTDSINASISASPLYGNGQFLQFFNSSKTICTGSGFCEDLSTRQVVRLDQTSCSNLKLVDSLEVFKWTCENDPDNVGKVRFVSTRFNDSKGLNDLISDTSLSPSWIPISLNLTNSQTAQNITISQNFYPFSNHLSYIPLSCVNASNTPQSYSTYQSCIDNGFNWVAGSFNSVYNVGDSNNTIFIVKKSDRSNLSTEQVKIFNLNLSNDKNSIIVMPGVSLYTQSNNQNAITVSNRNYFYIEGAFYGGGVPSTSNSVSAIYLSNSKYGILNLATVQNFSKGIIIDNSSYIKGKDLIISLSGSEGVLISSSSYVDFNRFTLSSNNYANLKLTNSLNNFFSKGTFTNALSITQGNGLELSNSSSNTFFENSISNNRMSGIYLSSSNSNIFVSNISSSNGSYGFFLDSSSLNKFVNNESSFNNNYGFYTNLAHKNFIHNLTSFNNNKSGIYINTSDQNYLSNLAIFSNTNSTATEGGITLTDSLYTKISGILYGGVNTQDCITNGTSLSNSFGGLLSNCSSKGLSTHSFISSNNYPQASSYKTQTQTAFSYSPTLFSSFSGFPFVFQKNDISYGSSARSFCSTGDCYLFDRTLNIVDNSLFNKSSDPINGNSSSTIISGANCPVEVSGNQTLSNGACLISSNWSQNYLDQDSCQLAGGTWSSLFGTTTAYTSPKLFLKSAVEIIDPENPAYGLGNHDGICENGEACVYSPNFGAYQGSGELNSCTYNSSGSSLNNVFIWGFPINGSN